MHQRGQALTEFLAIALALLPLFMLLPLIAKFQDIAHATQLASRYVAFDAFTRNDGTGTWKPADQLADEVRRRFFGRASAAVKTGDVAGDFNADRNLFWRDPTGRPLVASFADVNVGFGVPAGANPAAGFSAAGDGTAFPLHDRFGLAARGAYGATVTVQLARLPPGRAFLAPLDRIDLSIARSTAVVFDGWAAQGPRQAEERVGHSAAIHPAVALSAVGVGVDALVGLIDQRAGISGPQLGRLDFWRDVVPHDRLRPRAVQP